MRRGLILFAHGSRDPSWASSLETLSSEVRAIDPEREVRTAFLELQSPDLPTVIDEMAPRHTHLDICPVFWAATGHVRRDVPALLEAARRNHPDLSLRLLPALSDLPGLLAFVARAIGDVTKEPVRLGQDLTVPVPPPRA